MHSAYKLIFRRQYHQCYSIKSNPFINYRRKQWTQCRIGNAEEPDSHTYLLINFQFLFLFALFSAHWIWHNSVRFPLWTRHTERHCKYKCIRSQTVEEWNLFEVHGGLLYHSLLLFDFTSRLLVCHDSHSTYQVPSFPHFQQFDPCVQGVRKNCFL